MKKSVIAYVAVILGITGVMATGAYGYQKWQSARPTIENFDKALRIMWEEGEIGRSNRQCIEVPIWPKPDAQSKTKRIMVSHMDFITDGVTAVDRLQQIDKLDLLAKAGLLEKESAIIEVGEGRYNGNRYRVSNKGWVASAAYGPPSCFIYGKARYLGITKSEARTTKSDGALEVYAVQARIGIASVDELEPWAQSVEVQEAFPEIRKQLDGEEITVFLVRGDDGWSDYSKLAMRIARGSGGAATQSESGEAKEQRKKYQERLAYLSKLPAPGREEIERLVSEKFLTSDYPQWPSACLHLPSSGGLPVDRVLSTYHRAHYKVAVFSNKERKPGDKIIGKTQPYLDMLERLGVISKKVEENFQSGKSPDSPVYTAYVYTLTPEYADKVDSSYPNCFPLGVPSLEILALDIRDNDRNSQAGASVSYKVRLLYPNAPAWMHEPSLMNGWPELKGILEKGYACDGRFEFDKEVREMRAGGGSCWKVFDSDDENG